MTKIGRNDPCPCGSGRKYKQCCMRLHEAMAGSGPPVPGAPWPAPADNAPSLIALGDAHPAQGALEAAAEHYREALRIGPESPEAHARLGGVLQAQGLLEEAAAAYRSALALRPDSPELSSNLGNALHGLGRYEEAVECFGRALALKPDSAQVHGNLGLSYQALGRLDAAIEAQRQALRLEPRYAAAHFNLGLALQLRERLDEAIQSYRRALEFMPEYAQLHSNLGAALEKQGRVEEALASYQRAIELDPLLVAAQVGKSSLLAAAVPSWHVPMMNDTPRNHAYLEALKAAVSPQTRVLEIGTGSGLLAMMAAKCGAKTVTTCEAESLIAASARGIIEENGLASRIRVISKLSSDLTLGEDLKERADVLVCEIFSSELLGERVLASIEDAKRRLLEPGCRVIPAAGSVMIALFGGAALADNLRVGQVCGFDLSRFNAIAHRKRELRRPDLALEMLCDGIEAFRLDFERDDFFPPERRLLRIPVRSGGRCQGIVQWIRLEMDPHNRFENHPAAKTTGSGWEHIAYVLESPLELSPGQTVLVAAAHNRVFPWFTLAGVE
ncbi:MAG: tetratricopeptide repeat protein [Burkholderiales bacterium]|nr:tetratricopeptide repeat protein [Burkholderiales bacterium]